MSDVQLAHAYVYRIYNNNNRHDEFTIICLGLRMEKIHTHSLAERALSYSHFKFVGIVYCATILKFFNCLRLLSLHLCNDKLIENEKSVVSNSSTLTWESDAIVDLDKFMMGLGSRSSITTRLTVFFV